MRFNVRYIFCIVFALVWLHQLAIGDDASLPGIRKVWLDTNDSPFNVGSDSWTNVSLKEFQQILTKAEQINNAEKFPPWLIKAHYEVSIKDQILQGKSQLYFNNPHPIKAWTNLSPWSPSILPYKKESGLTLRTSDTGQNVRALIEVGRNQLLEMDFNSLGEERADGTYFQVQLPTCTMTTMQVRLPAGYRLDWPGNAQYVTGPFQNQGSPIRRWNLIVGSLSKREIQLIVRKEKDQQQQGWFESRLDADFVVGQREVIANYEFELLTWHERLRTISIDWPENIGIESIQLKKLDVELPVSAERISPSQLNLNLPEFLDQRVNIHLKGKWKYSPDQRIAFHTPAMQNTQLSRSSIRIVSSYDLPLIDWDWGDYLPSQAPQKVFSLDTGAEILTLTPRILTGNSVGKSPSAKLARRNNEINYVERNWWNIGREKNELTVQYHCTVSQGSMEFLSWRVPDGWQVKEINSEPSARLYAWNWQPGKALIVQLDKPLVPGNSVLVLVKLVKNQLATFEMEPRIEYLPRLIPVEHGSLTGSYAMSFEREETWLPPSFHVIKAPGQRTTPPMDTSELWSDQITVPDLYWQLHDLQASGTIQWQEWNESIQTSIINEIKDIRNGLELIYRLSIRPHSGRVTQVSVRFSSPVQNIVWKSETSTNKPFQWSPMSAIVGKLVWETPIVEEMILEARLPWHVDQPIPLLLADDANDIQLKVDESWEPVWDQGDKSSFKQNTDDTKCWRLLPQTQSPRLIRKKITDDVLINPQLITVLKNGYAENQYTVKLAATSNPLTLTIPSDAWLIEVLLDQETLETISTLTLPASDRVRILKLRYRQPVFSQFIYSRYHPVYPIWTSIKSTAIQHQVQMDQPALGLIGWSATINQGEIRTQQQQIHTLSWIPLEKYIILIFSVFAVSFLIGVYCSKWLKACLVILLIILAFLFPSYGWVLFVSGSLGLVSYLVLKAVRTRYAIVLIFLPVLTLAGQSWIQACDDQKIEMVYIISDATGDTEKSRVMVPAKLWTLLQSKAAQSAAGIQRPWWIREVHTTGELGLQHLRLTAEWKVVVEGSGPVDIPWLESKPPQAVRLNGVLHEPRMVLGPFGIQQFVFRIKEPGEHTLQVDWDLKVQAFRGMETASIKWPGAPVQTLSLKHVASDTQVSGIAGLWTIQPENQRYRLDADVGMVSVSNLAWFTPAGNNLPVVADVGVLWEHRASESVAHAVISFQMDNTWLDKISLNIPLNTRVRNLNVTGDLFPNPTPRIRNWNLKAGSDSQELTIQLQRPVTGRCVLLLELPWIRNQVNEKIPLYGIEVNGADIRNNFVAYLLDGITGKSDRELTPIQKSRTDFARPWLPSLALLPGSSIIRMPGFREVPASIQIQSEYVDATLKTRLDIQLDLQQVTYRFTADSADKNVPVYLTGQIDPGIKIQDISGESVIRWHQTAIQSSGPSQLFIWLSGKSKSEQQNLFTIRSSIPIEHMDKNRVRIPLFAIRWDGISIQEHLPITLRNLRPYRSQLASYSPGLMEHWGPHLETNILGQWSLPISMPFGSMIVLQEESRKQSPTFTKLWDNAEKCWRYTLQASTDETLPAELELMIQNGKIEDDWQFEANVPLVSRPVRGQKAELVWALQLARPVKRLQIKMKPAARSEGKQVEPVISFPAWSTLVSP
ncbi:MAG: DUF308 domain-containing protein [Planctomycetia bacterium]|nr:DUF308 domain-containing protein [Planctomycetia bacterium]